MVNFNLTRTRVPLAPLAQVRPGGLPKSVPMLIGEFCRRVGRSPDTIKRWEDLGLLPVARDARGRRLYSESDLLRAHQLAQLGLLAQTQSRKISALAKEAPQQLGFDFSPPVCEQVA